MSDSNEVLLRVVQAITALHHPYSVKTADWCDCWKDYEDDECNEDGRDWPCPTIFALRKSLPWFTEGVISG